MKHLKLLEDDEDYGFFSVGRKVAVNLDKLRRIAKDEDQLITYICKIWHHENLHYHIHRIVWDLYVEREEEIVEKLSGTAAISDKKAKELYWVIDVD